MTMERSAATLSAAPAVDENRRAWASSSSTPGRLHGQNSQILLTGATGFLGQYLLRDLVRRGYRVAVLVRADGRGSAMGRVRQIFRDWQGAIPHEQAVTVLTGNITAPNLGLSTSAREWVRRNCRTVLHNAASVHFAPAERDREPWTTNLSGTERVLSFCAEQGIHDLQYVSTAYVCGVREGVIREAELAVGQTFRNPYEASKCEAEQMVQSCDQIAHRTIYRPSIITGDSHNGATCSYHGMMWYLKLFDLLIPQQPRNQRGKYLTDIVLPIDGDEPHDVVNVDWVAQTIVQLLANPAARDKVFHVTASQPTTIRQVVSYCCDYYNSEGVVYGGKQAERRATSDFADLVFRMAQAYHGYEQSSPQFDRSNLLAMLPGCSSPVIDRDMVFRFIEFGRRDRWGKRQRISAPSPGAEASSVRLVEVE